MDIVRPAAGPAGLDAAGTTPGGLVPANATPPGLTPYRAPEPSTKWRSGFPDPDFRYLEDSAWKFAPSSSHLSRWLAYESDGRFYLLVRFKGSPRKGGESRTYTYFYESARELEQIDTALSRSPHPFSQVLNPLVIKAGVPVS